MSNESRNEFKELKRELLWFAFSCFLFLLSIISLLVGLGGFLYGFGVTFFASILKGVGFMFGSGVLVILGLCLGGAGYVVWYIGDREVSQDD